GLFGLYPWSDIPAIPPEIVLLPPSAPISIYDFSAWSRTIIVPLSVLYAIRPERRIPGLSVDGLRTGARIRCKGSTLERAAWWAPVRVGFLAIDRMLKTLEPMLRRLPSRRAALSRAERWIAGRIGEGGLGAIYPAILNSILALHALGYDRRHPVLDRAWNALLDLVAERGEAIRFLPCTPPVWDTALGLYAVLLSGLAPDASEVRASSRWLYAKQGTTRGDWSIKNPRLEPGGWFFEFENAFYPDNDDTAMVLLALDRALPGENEDRAPAMLRGLRWLLGMQNRDGGWGAFDRDLDKKILEAIPFADHNAMLDGSTADVTGRVLLLLGQLGFSGEQPVVRRAVRYLLREQEPDGSWYGRWGVNYVYGTSHVLQGLRSIGYPVDRPSVRRAAAWLRSVQRDDGGWGESCASYGDRRLKGEGPSTASQTAWGLMGLLSAGDTDSAAVRRGIEFLLRAQNPDGSWTEEAYTGTGFPEVFYLQYAMYSQYFPLMALSMARTLRQDPRAFIGRPASLGPGLPAERIRALGCGRA
ncbi:MAG: squalene--hopene cyclase, partial [Planctomycetes bacterium]|nr:squalene--hopene cyclase [Planctomycetota bacterium]